MPLIRQYSNCENGVFCSRNTQNEKEGFCDFFFQKITSQAYDALCNRILKCISIIIIIKLIQ